MRAQAYCLLCLIGFSPAAFSDAKAPDAGAAMKKAQGLVRQLSQEKSALEAERNGLRNDKLQLEIKVKQLEEAVKALAPLQAEVERYKTGLETLKTNLESQLGQERENRQKLLQKHNDTVTKANAIYADNQLLVAAVKEREQWITQCSEQNNSLISLNQDIVRQYRDKSLLQQALELEPLTGIGKVETQNIAENYRYQLHQLQITPFQASQATPEAKTDAENAPADSAEPPAPAEGAP